MEADFSSWGGVIDSLQVVGASRIGAMLLINMGVSQAFIAMRNLLDRHCLRSFYGGPSAKEDVRLTSLSWPCKVTPVTGRSILPVRSAKLGQRMWI